MFTFSLTELKEAILGAQSVEYQQFNNSILTQAATSCNLSIFHCQNIDEMKQQHMSIH